VKLNEGWNGGEWMCKLNTHERR